MSVPPTDDGRTPSRPRPPADVPPGDVGLRSVVVHYDEGPDRCTVYPDGVPDQARLTRWLSADADAFVDLGARR